MYTYIYVYICSCEWRVCIDRDDGPVPVVCMRTARACLQGAVAHSAVAHGASWHENAVVRRVAPRISFPHLWLALKMAEESQ